MKKKKLFFVALATLFVLTVATSAQAVEPFFLNKQGVEAEYAIKDAKGTITSYTKSVVTSLSSADPKNFTITFTSEVFDKNRKSLASPVTSTVSVKDGAVDVTPAIEGVEIEGSMPSYPASLSVGQVLNYSFSMKTMGVKTTTSGKNTVAAKESVTTAAGTFDCFKIEGEVSTKALLQTTKIKTTSWIAEGIGAVKTETYDGKGKLQMSMELVSKK